MMTKTLKWSSVLLISSGILLAVSMVFHPDMTVQGFALRTAWVPVHVLFGISALIGLAGLVLLYMSMGPDISAFGQVAFWISIIGLALLAGLMFLVEATLVPILAADPSYSPLLAAGSPLMTGSFGAVVGTTIIAAVIGLVILAVYLIRSRTVSNANGIFLMVGAPLAFFASVFSDILGVIGGVLLGIGLLWLGISIRSGQAHSRLEPIARVQDECFLHAGGHA